MSCLSMSPIKWTSLLGHVECSPEGNTMENNNWWRVSLGGVAPRTYHPTFTGMCQLSNCYFHSNKLKFWDGKNVKLASCYRTASESCPKLIWKLCVKIIKREYFQTFMWQTHTTRKCISFDELITRHDAQNGIYNLSVFPQLKSHINQFAPVQRAFDTNCVPATLWGHKTVYRTKWWSVIEIICFGRTNNRYTII